MSERRGVEIGDLLHFRFPSRPTLSPDAAQLLFVVQQADAETNRYRSAIWHTAVDAPSPAPLTRGGSDTDPLWLDDGRVLFKSGRDTSDDASPRQKRSSAYYVIAPDGGEAEHWFTIDRPVTWMRQLDETRFVVLTRWDPTWSEERKEHESRVHVFDQVPIWSNGVGFVHGGGVRLGLFDAGEGELTDLTPASIRVASATLSPRRTKVLLVTTENASLYRPESRLELVDLATPSGRVDLSEHAGLPDGYYSIPGFVDESTLLFGFADRAEHGLNTSPQIYRLDLGSHADARVARRLTAHSTLRMGVNSVGSDARLGSPDGGLVRGDESGLYLVGTQGSDSALYRVDPEGAIETLTDAPGSVDAFDVVSGTVATVAMRDGRLPEVYLLAGPMTTGSESRVTALNDEWFERVETATPARLAVSSNGDEIDAWVLLPTGLDEERSIPAILTIHGGPRSVYGTVFRHEMQVWAARGFAVIFANPHGSDGRGDVFADIRGRYGSVDYEDLMTVVDRALERFPVIDPERLCVTGGSYGGFMTNWMIGHTHRFAAAASQRSISNWISFWGTSDIGHYFGDDQTATDPWSDPQELWRQSPLAYANAVKTPTLLLHSDADQRCWIVDSIQMHAALVYHGVEARLVWIEGENHELSRAGKPGPRLRRLQEIIGWFVSHAADGDESGSSSE